MKSNTSLVLSLAYCLVGISLQSPPASAQITRDGTTSTTVNVNGNNFEINQGDRIGDNLFHSFNEFSVPTLGSAAFNNALDIVNIFSRVTGNSISDIDGLISANGTANLFLINPNGIIFGENASLNLGGSFFASTADSLLFEDNLEFSAVNPQAPPLLKVNMPIGLNLGNNPGEIVNRSFVQNSAGDFVGLQVTPGENLTLVGGNINFEAGEATARGGNIELGGLSAAGTVGINDDGSLSFPEDVAQADITLINAADIDVRGTGGGSITINARNLNLEAGDFGRSLIRAGITADSTSVAAQAGDIRINATDNVTVDDSSISNRVDSGAKGNAGGVTINTGSLYLTNGGQVDSGTFGIGNTGLVDITATGNIMIDGEDSFGSLSGVFSRVFSGAKGNAGGVTINTSSLSLTNGGQVDASTQSQGSGGSVKITATDTIIIDGDSDGYLSSVVSVVDLGAKGDAGSVSITTGSLFLNNGGQVDTSTFGIGDAGSIEIIATDTILIDGESSLDFPSGATSTVGIEAEGNAGDVTINTGSLTLTNGGRVDANTGGQGNGGSVKITATDTILIDGENSLGFPSGANSAVVVSGAKGDAGGVTINTASLTLTNGGRVDVSTFGIGNAGSLEITATDTILIDGKQSSGFASGANSVVNPGAEGDAGSVTINTGSLTLTNGGQVSATTGGQGNAGDVTVNARESISISGITEDNRSGISADAFVSSGNGGDVNVFTNQLTIDNGGTIEAGNFDNLGVFEPGTGKPGNINIQANSLSLSNQASIEAATQSEIGEGANINLTIAEDIIFKNNSLVSARALQNADGGNVIINASDGFIIAFPNQNNDIIANAQQGNGGRINISTQAIFGLEERRSTPPNQTNDIDASSEFGLQGEITINTPEADPTKGLIELPESVGDASDQISQNPCERGIDSKFISTGKGGLRPNPTETLSSSEVWKDVQLPTQLPKNSANTVNHSNTTPERIVEATGWIINEAGIVELVAEESSATNQDSCR